VRASFIHSPRFAEHTLGEGHPFRPDRARLLHELLERQGWLDEAWMQVVEPDQRPLEAWAGSVDPDFILAIQRASRGEVDASLIEHGLGSDECPIFPGLEDYVALYCAATMTAVRLVLSGEADLVFNPLGGMHHSSRRVAEGFCYVNDVLIAVDSLLAARHRVAVIDIDAHHGNGVEDAYLREPRVLCASLHESGETLYPWRGALEDRGEGAGRGLTINAPLPAGADDEVALAAFDGLIAPPTRAFEPTICIAVVGADTHRTDPLSHLQLTNNGMVSLMERIRGFAPQLIMLGCGGYAPQATARAWARMWAAANRIDDTPDHLSMMGGVFIGGQDLAGGELVDMAFRLTGPEKQRMMAAVAEQVRQVSGLDPEQPPLVQASPDPEPRS
jgi:acetoin utilization protein AcuC